MEKKAASCRNRYTWLRMTTIVGGVIAPILVTLSLNSAQDIKSPLHISTVLVGGVVAASSAIEGFFSYGRQWYGYRQSVESLKSQGWQFFQLTGPYQGRTHQDSFSFFAAQVEELIQRDVALYATQLSQQQQQQQQLEQRFRPST